VATRSRITGDRGLGRGLGRGPCRGPCRVPDRGHRGGCRRSDPAPSAGTAGNCEFRSPPSCRGGTVRGIPRGRPPVRIRGASVWFSLIASCLWFTNADSSGCTAHAGGPRAGRRTTSELRNGARAGSSAFAETTTRNLEQARLLPTRLSGGEPCQTLPGSSLSCSCSSSVAAVITSTAADRAHRCLRPRGGLASRRSADRPQRISSIEICCACVLPWRGKCTDMGSERS
jgi:hypothetical protein